MKTTLCFTPIEDDVIHSSPFLLGWKNRSSEVVCFAGLCLVQDDRSQTQRLPDISASSESTFFLARGRRRVFRILFCLE